MCINPLEFPLEGAWAFRSGVSCVTVPTVGEVGPCRAHLLHSLVTAKEELLVFGFLLDAFMKKKELKSALQPFSIGE